MTEERRVTRDGIHIDREIADAVAIEEELDSNVVGPYRFPDPVRRRIPGVIYALLALVVALAFSPVVALLPLALAVWHLVGAWPLSVRQEHALSEAAAVVEFPVGHASAALAFHGWLGRPRWSVILYSAVEPPDQRALVVIDGVSGEVLENPYIEPI